MATIRPTVHMGLSFQACPLLVLIVPPTHTHAHAHTHTHTHTVLLEAWTHNPSEARLHCVTRRFAVTLHSPGAGERQRKNTRAGGRGNICISL